MVGIAVVFGLLAVFVAQGWLNYQAELSRKTVAPKPQAGGDAHHRDRGGAAALRRARRAGQPARGRVAGRGDPGRHVRVDRRADRGGKRIVLASIERNEPILRTKITGPGQKATLSAVIQDGMRAVTVRVNDVEGVAGFVLPGDHVDVLLTRQAERTSGTNDVVIQNTRVLAVDQLADDAADRPTVVRAVTLEVDTIGGAEDRARGARSAISR